jgi:hypothetical protein
MTHGVRLRSIAFAATALSCASARAHAGGLEVIVFGGLLVGAIVELNR